jgi:hypothetical protein
MHVEVSAIHPGAISWHDLGGPSVSGSNARFDRRLECCELLFARRHQLRVKMNDGFVGFSVIPCEAFDKRRQMFAMRRRPGVNTDSVSGANAPPSGRLPVDLE